MIKLETPISNKDINNLKIGDKVLISGIIYTGRDAVLPKLKKIIQDEKIELIPFDLNGSVFMHTAVSKSGIAPTTSNKTEIESSISLLSQSGVKIHIGKGSLSDKTIKSLKKENSIFFITPPVAAVLTDKVISKEVVMFKEEGIESIFKLKVKAIPAIVAIAHGKSIYS
ncbi:MAG: fumarate hydratase C-terminal domain-containing protein [Methanobrevibacter sp.]|jgi:fumarate hydratase subunit beta|nr:fumarate hydratase C-terminal domain-containing protein [Candidatus Methanoflexus mossambicus]